MKENQNFQDFQKYCCEAFQIVRESAHVIMNLIKLMITTGVEQINEETIEDLQNLLALASSEQEADAFFKLKIEEAVGESRRLDNAIHLF